MPYYSAASGAIREGKVLVCQDCGSLVAAGFTATHEAWHERIREVVCGGR
jgi:hypothetical protein